MELLHKELTYQIRACIYEVRKEIGVGFDEETYHQGLLLSFHRHNMPFVSKEKRSLLHRGTLIRDFVNDYLLFDKIIIKDQVGKAEQPILDQITKAIKDVASLHKPGYGKVVWRKIVEAELSHLLENRKCISQAFAPLKVE